MRTTPPKAAQWAGVTRRTVTNWIRQGTVSATRDSSGRYTVDLHEVMRRAEWKNKQVIPNLCHNFTEP